MKRFDDHVGADVNGPWPPGIDPDVAALAEQCRMFRDHTGVWSIHVAQPGTDLSERAAHVVWVVHVLAALAEGLCPIRGERLSTAGRCSCRDYGRHFWRLLPPDGYEHAVSPEWLTGGDAITLAYHP